MDDWLTYDLRFAYSLMQWQCEDCRRWFTVWNSRPNTMVYCAKCPHCGGYLVFECHHARRCCPEYQPAPGDLIIVGCGLHPCVIVWPGGDE